MSKLSRSIRSFSILAILTNIYAIGYTVSGSVTSRNFPYSGVKDIRVQTDTGQTATTDWGGNYTLDNVPAGNRTITASHPNSDYYATGTSLTVSTTRSVSANLTGVNFNQFACRGTASVSITTDKTVAAPGDIIVVTVYLRNSNYSLSDVLSFMDVSFSTSKVTVGTVSSNFGWDSVTRFPVPSSIQHWDSSGNQTTITSTEYLISGQREGTYTFNTNYYFSFPITVRADATAGTIRLKYRGTIGDSRDPASGSTDQQGMYVRTTDISVVLPPVITYFAINNDASSTTSRTVTLNNACTNSPTHYMASENSSFTGASWQTYATGPSFTLSSGNGSKRVYFKVKNSVGESDIDAYDNIQLNEPVYTVSGRVTSRNFPYAGIKDIQIEADTGQTATTDRGGNYMLTNVPTGTRTISASHANNDYYATGTSYSASTTRSVTGNLTGVNFGQFACRGSASVTLTADKATAGPGETVVINITLSNTNYSLSDVIAFLDVSFPVDRATVGTVSSSTGWDTVIRYPVGASIEHWDSSGNETTISSTEYLVSGEREGSYYNNSTYSFSFPITIRSDATTGTIRFKYRGTIGDSRDPASGTQDQQGLYVRTFDIPVVQTYAVAGRVMSRNFPYAGIKGVLVQADSGQTSTTEWDGSYILDNVPEGNRTISASHPHNDYYATGTAFSASVSINVSSNLTDVNFSQFACLGTAAATITFDRNTVAPGGTINITVSLQNTNYALSDVVSYLDLSFPMEKISDVGTPTGSGWTSPLEQYPVGSAIWVYDSSGNMSQSSSTEYLISATRLGDFGHLSPVCTFTVPITIRSDASDGQFELKYRGTIGDSRDPASQGSGNLDQQGLNIKSTAITVSRGLEIFGTKVGGWDIPLFGESFSVRSYALNGAEYMLPFSVPEAEADVNNVIVDEKLAQAILQEWAFQNHGFGPEALQNRITQELQEIRDYHNLDGGYWAEYPLVVLGPAGLVLQKTVFNKRIAERATIGATSFFLADQLVKAKLSGAMSLGWEFPIALGSFILGLTQPDIEKEEIQALLLYYKLVGDTSPGLASVLQAFNLAENDYANAIRTGSSVLGIGKYANENYIHLRDIYQLGIVRQANDTAKALLRNTLNAGYYTFLSTALVNLSGATDFKKIVQAWGYIHDEHCDVIYNLTGSLIKIGEEILSLRSLPRTAYSTERLPYLENRFAWIRMYLLPLITEELYRSQYLHILRVRQNVWTPLAFLGGAGRQSSADALEVYNSWKDDQEDWAAAHLNYEVDAWASYAEYRAAIYLLEKNKTVDRIAVRQPDGNRIQFKAGQSSVQEFSIENTSEDELQNVQVTFNSPFEDIVASASAVPTNIASSQSVGLLLNVQIPYDWFARFIPTVDYDPNAINPYVELPFTVTYEVGGSSRTENESVPLVIMPPGKITSIAAERMSYRTGERANLTVEFEIDQPSSVYVVLNGYYPNGDRAGFGGINTSQRQVSAYYDITEAHYGSYGIGAYVMDSQGHVLVPEIVCPRVFNVLPPVNGVDVIDYNNLAIVGKQDGDGVVAKDLAETIGIDESAIIWCDGLSYDQIMSNVNGKHMLLVGGEQVNPIVARLVANGILAGNKWLNGGDCSVDFLQEPLNPGQHVLVVAGYRARDTEVAGISYATYFHNRSLAISSESWNAPPSGGQSDLIVITNSTTGGSFNFTIQEDADWLEVSSAGGRTPASISLSAIANNSGAARQVEVRVIGMEGVKNSPRSILVTQDATGVLSPEISLKQESLLIADGDSLVFSDTNVGSSSRLTVTIENLGGATLVLSGNPAVVIAGENANEFAIEQQPVSTVNPGQATTFVIAFSPTSSGAKNAFLSIANNDSDENPYDISLVVIVPPPGAFDLTSPANVTAIPRLTPSVTLSWTASANATSYDVYFGMTRTPELHANTTDTSLSVTVAKDLLYYWNVVAINGTGTTSSTRGPFSFGTGIAFFSDFDDGMTQGWGFRDQSGLTSENAHTAPNSIRNYSAYAEQDEAECYKIFSPIEKGTAEFWYYAPSTRSETATIYLSSQASWYKSPTVRFWLWISADGTVKYCVNGTEWTDFASLPKLTFDVWNKISLTWDTITDKLVLRINDVNYGVAPATNAGGPICQLAFMKGSWSAVGTFAYIDDIKVTTTPAPKKKDLLATWDGQGVYYRDSDTRAWVRLASSATMIANGDIDNDGIDDVFGLWPSQRGIWARHSSNGAWTWLSSTARHIAAGDMNGDGRVDFVGTWDGQGVFYRDSATGAWAKLASPATLITAGDLDGDGTDDLIGIWPGQGGVWAKYSRTGAWSKISSTARDIAAGDMNGDGRDELLATWDGQGVYYRDSFTGAWTRMASEATQVTCGDLDGDGMDDLIGIWPTQGGVWVKYSTTEAWARISSTAIDISAGLMRLQESEGTPMAAAVAIELPMAMGDVGGIETAVNKTDLSSDGPGGARFIYIQDINLEPAEDPAAALARRPGPGEPGFVAEDQKNMIPGEKMDDRVRQDHRELKNKGKRIAK